jgi:hypothetical protein
LPLIDIAPLINVAPQLLGLASCSQTGGALTLALEIALISRWKLASTITSIR